MTDILLVGTFHFKEENIDFGADDIQKQLDEISLSISKFAPTAVAVELDLEKYGAPIGLPDIEWKKELSESFLLGGRIACYSGLNVIHPIDKVFPLNPKMITPKIAEQIAPRIHFLQKTDELRGIKEKLAFINSVEYRLQDANMYLDINSQNQNGEYFESKCLTDWYFRNLCIFSNLQRLSKQYDKIVVLYGAGHIPILRDLVNASDSMNLIDIELFL